MFYQFSLGDDASSLCVQRHRQPALKPMDIQSRAGPGQAKSGRVESLLNKHFVLATAFLIDEAVL